MRFSTATALLASACLTSALPGAPGASVTLSELEQIQQVQAVYAIATDTKDWARYGQVFTQNAFANYTTPLDNLQGLPAIEKGLKDLLANVTSQHLMGTFLVDFQSATAANSTTYFRPELFGNPYKDGETITQYGKLLDSWTKTSAGWRVYNRVLIFQGAGNIGDLALISGEQAAGS
jgi:hypothetical protein